MIKQSNDEEDSESIAVVNEKTGTTVESKWIFEIFQGENGVFGIHQVNINGSDNCSKFIGTPKGTAVRIELLNGEEVQKLIFTGLN